MIDKAYLHIIVLVYLITISIISTSCGLMKKPDSDQALLESGLTKGQNTQAIDEILCAQGKCNEVFLKAVQEGDIKKVKKLVSLGTDINAEDSESAATALMLALGNIQIMDALIEKGADVNAANKYGTTPLMWAARSGNLEAAQILISKGAKVNWRNREEVTPLMDAAYGGNPKIVKLFLEYGAKVNDVADFGVSALMRAAFLGQLEIVQILLKSGADVSLKDHDGHTAISNARDEYMVRKINLHGTSCEKRIGECQKELDNYQEIIRLLKQAESER